MVKRLTNVPRKYRRSLISLFGLAVVTALAWKPLAISYGNWLAAGSQDATGDLSVLLSGNNIRLKTLIELYDRGKVGGIYYAAGIDETQEQLEGYQQIFAQYELPTQDLYCGELVESTFHEAQAFNRKLATIERSVDKIVLVSDRYHLRRGIWSFNQVLDDIEVVAYSTPSPPEIADSHWWKHEAGRQQVISETKKMGFYWLYYGLLNRDRLITHGDVAQITTGKVSRGVEQPCEIVLPQLSQTRSN